MASEKELATREIDSLILNIESKIAKVDYTVRMASTAQKKLLRKYILSALKHCSSNLHYAKELIYKYQEESPNANQS